MAKKRRRRTKSHGEPARKTTVERSHTSASRRWTLAALGVVAALSLALYFAFAGGGPPADIPDPDRTLMEPQVAAKIQNYRREVEKAPDSHEAWGDLGVVLHAHGLEQDATVCYRKALELAPADFRWHYLLVQALLAYDHDAALEASADALAVSADYPPLLIARAELLEERNMTDGVAELYARALKISPDSAAAELALGRIAIGEDDLESARKHLERAAELSPDAGAVHAALARLYRRLGDNEKATEAAQRVRVATRTVPVDDPIRTRMRREAVSSTAMLTRARNLTDMGDLASAEAIYRDMVALRPGDVAMKVRLADVLSLRNGWSEAEALYEEALAIKGDDAAAHYGLAAVRSHAGDHEEALAHLEASLEQRGADGPTLVSYANTLAMLGRDDEAESHYGAAIEAEPDSVTARRALAEFLFVRRRYSEAAQQYERVLELEPELGVVHLQLGATLAATGELVRARSHLDRAQELGEAVPEAVRARVDAAPSSLKRQP